MCKLNINNSGCYIHVATSDSKYSSQSIAIQPLLSGARSYFPSHLHTCLELNKMKLIKKPNIKISVHQGATKVK